MEMKELEKVIRGLRDIDMFIAGRLEHEKAKNFLRTIDETIALLKEQEEKIKNRDESLEKAREEIKWLRGMLKEQEAVEPTFKQDKDGIYVWACGSCGAYMYHIYEGIDKAKEYAKFCRQCGKAVKWE